MGDSLIRLNVVTGDTLRHAFTAGVKEPLKSRFSFAKERRTLPSSDFTREAIFSTGIGAVLTGTHSNIIFSGDSLFVADAEHFYCLDKKLNTRWMADLCRTSSTTTPSCSTESDFKSLGLLMFSIYIYLCLLFSWCKGTTFFSFAAYPYCGVANPNYGNIGKRSPWSGGRRKVWPLGRCHTTYTRRPQFH